MSTIKTTNITHGSNSGTANIVLASDGGITFAKKPALGRQVLEQLDSSITYLQNITGKLNQELEKEEFLNSVRLRLSHAGGG